MTTVNIGTVEFSLVGNVSQLDQVRNVLRALHADADVLFKRRDEASQAQYAATVKTLSTIGRLQEQIRGTRGRLVDAGASVVELDKLAQKLDLFAKKRADLAAKGQGWAPHKEMATERGFAWRMVDIEKTEKAAAAMAARQIQMAQTQEVALHKIQERATMQRNLIQQNRDMQEHTTAAKQSQTLQALVQKRQMDMHNADVKAAAEHQKIVESRDMWTRNNAIKQAIELGRIQNSYERTQNQVRLLNARAEARGVPQSFIQANTANVAALGTAVQTGNMTAATAAQRALQKSMTDTRVVIAGLTPHGEKLAAVFRNFERSAILAVGPLSGIGARLAVISALLESTSVKATAAIATMVGLGYAFTSIATAAIKATMEQQKFDAILEAASGGAILVSSAYSYAATIADKLGLSVRGMIEPYAKFATAARLSGLTLMEQRDVFEGAMIASTAMRLDTQRTGLVFLALEQMVSKGTVSMEELRRQLGDLLPGTMNIAAKAMGVPISRLYEMIRAGDVLAKELVPAMAAAWKEIYGPAAGRGAKTLQADLERLGNASFEVKKRFDEVTKASTIFQQMVIGVRSVLVFITDNMIYLNKVMGFTAGILAGVLVGGFIGTAAAAVAATKALGFFVLGLRGVDIAAATTAAGRLIGWLARIGTAAALAGAGYYMLEASEKKAIEAMEKWLEEAEVSMGIWERMKEVDQATADQWRDNAYTRMRSLGAEIAKTKELLETRKRSLTEGSVKYGPNKEIIETPPISADEAKRDETVLALEAILADYVVAESKLKSFIERFGKLKIIPAELEDKIGKPWRNWIKSFEEDTQKFLAVIDMIGAAKIGPSMMAAARAVADARELIAKEPEEKKGDKEFELLLRVARVGKILKEQLDQMPEQAKALEEYFERAGIATDSALAWVARFKLANKEAEATLGDIRHDVKDVAASGKNYADAWREVTARLAEAKGLHDEDLKFRETVAVKVMELDELMKRMNLTDVQRNALLAEYKGMWGDIHAAEKDAKETKEILKHLEQIENKGTDTFDKIQEAAKDALVWIDKALEKRVIGEMKAADLRTMVEQRAFNDMMKSATLFGKDMKEMMGSVEKTFEEMFEDIAFNGGMNMKKLLQDLERYIWNFVTKMLIIKPIMQGLFGGAYDTSMGSNLGLFGSFLKGASGASGMGSAPFSWWSGGDSLYQMLGSFGNPTITGVAAASGAEQAIGLLAGTLATGTDFVPETGLYQLHQGEAVIPARENMERRSSSGTVINFNVQATDANSFRASKNQILADLHVALSKSQRNL